MKKTDSGTPKTKREYDNDADKKEIAEELKSSDDDQCSAECLEKLIYHKAVI